MAAWLVLQIGEVVLEPLGFPAWSMRTLIIIAIIGFPLSFILAWIIDLRQEGLIFDLPLWIGDETNPRPQKNSDLLFALLLGILIVGGTYYMVVRLLGDIVPDTPVAQVDTTAPNSIAVLAFENFSEGAEVDYFAAGLAEEILNLLAAVRELNVVSRTSSFQFRGRQVDIRDVAELLEVRHVLEGSARKDGDRIRVVAQLIDGVSGYHDWSATYERPLNDIFAIQQEIAAAVVNELKIAMSIDSADDLRLQATEDINAYVFYLEGRGRLRSSLDADATAAASQLFEQAVAIDPGFARAHAGLCEAQLRLYEISGSVDSFQVAEAACSEASRLDPGLNVETRIALGTLYRYRGWYARAIDQLDAALEIDPTAVDAYIELGAIRAAEQDREAAEAALLRAVDLKRNYWRAREALASFYYRTERYTEAAVEYEIVTSLAPDVASAFAAKGGVYWMLGDMPKAMAAYEESLRLKPSRQGYTNLGLRYYYAGRFDEAAEMQLRALEFAPDDHRVWGRLAESYRFSSANQGKAREAYEQAAQHAETALEINDEDWRTTGLLGLYYAHLDRPADAIALINRAVEQSQRNSATLYFLALAHLRNGDRNLALDVLEEAVAADPQYSTFIESDPDLQVLRDEPRFISLLPASG